MSINFNASTVDVGVDLPDLFYLYPTDSELVSRAAATRTLTLAPMDVDSDFFDLLHLIDLELASRAAATRTLTLAPMDVDSDLPDLSYPTDSELASRAAATRTFTLAPMDVDSDLPDLIYPTDSELASRAAKTRVATFGHSDVAEAAQYSQVPKFRVFQTLGTGGFATAVLAQSSMEPSRVFCLKVFQKDRLKDIEEIIMDELAPNKRIATLLPCPARNFLVGLEFSFQTKHEIIFAMDLMAGDLSMYMIDRPSYCSGHSHRWAAQIALGIHTLHAMGIIHRDIKPENILIDARENVRVADYGLCYVDEQENPLYRERVYSTSAVGTIYCMAPEVLRNVLDPDSMEYGIPVDWWSFGCVMVQLFSRNHEAMFYTKGDILWYVDWCSSRDRLARRRVFRNQKFHPDIAVLLSGLLDPEPSTRYGMPQIVCNKAFSCVSGNGNTLFTNAYNQAEEREELPDSLPKFQDDDPSEEWCGLLPGDTQHIPNIDWVKPDYEQ